MRTIEEMVGSEWYRLLENTIHSSPMKELGERLMQVWGTFTPNWDNVFKAYELTPPSRLKVLILGQDPYPKPGQAMGLAFSSGNHQLPYSLENIFKDLALCNYDHRMRKDVDLTDWAEQGVMLLNTCLTTQIGHPFAHKGWGWEYLVRATLGVIDGFMQPYVVMAWGKAAQEQVVINISSHRTRKILCAAHPANERYQRGSYIGSKHFTLANEFLKEHGTKPIEWM